MTRQLRGMSPSAEQVVVGAMIIGAAALRLVPHPPNFTPVLAIALFGGAQFATKKAALTVPLLAMLASDLVLELLYGSGIHSLMPVVYVFVAASVAAGFALRRRRGPVLVLLAAFASSVAFSVATNFVVWMTTGWYPRTAAGLVECYVAALPFFRNTLAATLIYSVGLFGGHTLLTRRLRVRRQQA
jgi:hypothetical protein